LPQSDFSFIKYFNAFRETNLIENVSKQARARGVAKEIASNFVVMYPKRQKSQGIYLGCMGDGSNGEY
jgi:hypothetical protein